MGVEVLDVDIAPEQMNVFEINDTYLPEIDRKGESSSKHSDDSSNLIDSEKNLNSKHGLVEPAKSGSVDNSHEMNGGIEEIAEVEAARHPINLVENSQEFDGGTIEIKELEATNHQINFVDNSQELNAGRKETNEADSTNLSKDAVDVCPAPKQIHRFCFVKFRPYEDPKLKAKIEQADKDLGKKNETRFQIIEALKAKKSERANVISKLKPLTGENKRYRTFIDVKREEMEPLTTALGKLQDMNSSGREKGIGLCSSDELDDLLVGIDMDEVRMEVVSKMEHLERELQIIDDGISFLQEDLSTITEKRDTSFRILSELRKERDEANGCFYKNRSLLSNAKILAAKKNKATLEELCHNEVERFMAQWNNNKAFRDDYDRRILPSLDIRQLSRDGRRRNLDEKPIREARLANEVEKASLKMTTSESNEKLVLPPQDNVVDKPKIQQEVKSSTEVEPTRQSDHLEGTEKNYEIESKDLQKGNDVDLEKLKETRREEEIAKAKLAMEHKKLAEKAAAKAATRAQKEAEKKMKEKEKKAKNNATSGEQPETVKEKTSEPDETKVSADVHNPTIKKEPKTKVNYKA